MERRLSIVNEAGEIIGETTRTEIHAQGLLHQEIHVWFYLPNGELLFQRRSKDAETAPGLLDATVGGHVEIGETYEEAALHEVEEETGVSVTLTDLTFLGMRITRRSDSTGKINNARRQSFAYRYNGKVEDLKIENGKSQGFETWPIDTLFHFSEEERAQFIPVVIDGESLEYFRKIKSLL